MVRTFVVRILSRANGHTAGAARVTANGTAEGAA
jgi:hypothetical protein